MMKKTGLLALVLALMLIVAAFSGVAYAAEDESGKPIYEIGVGPFQGETTGYKLTLGSSYANQQVCVDGVDMTCDSTGTVVIPGGKAKVLEYFSFNKTEGDPHGIYPTSMKVFLLEFNGSKYTAKQMPAFDNLLQFGGVSIKFTEPRGIRIITGIPADKRDALCGSGYAGYTAEEYGTMLMFASDVTATNPFTFYADELKYGSAYRRADGYSKIFARTGSLVQYTNPLQFSSNDVCGKELVLRSYMKLKNSKGEQIILYGGPVSRTIKYVAERNISKYTPGSQEYNYLINIINDEIETDTKKLIGHMGQKSLAPGNTVESFNLAVNNNMWGIECDLRSTKDGVLICAHADNASVTTDGSGEWQNLEYSYVKELEITKDEKKPELITKYPGLHIATFEQYLDICKINNCVALVDVKWMSSAAGTKAALEKAVQTVSDKGMLGKTIFQVSKSTPEYIGYINGKSSAARTWYLCNELNTENIQAARTLGCVGINVIEGLTSGNVAAAHSAGLKVAQQTATTTAEKNNYFNIGVDFVLCNEPI